MQETLLSDLAAACGGRLYGDDARVRGVVIDSRKSYPGALFAAFPGERSDGYEFIPQAYAAGAAAALCDRAPRAKGSYILVKDPLRAYWDLAAWHRSRFDIRVLAVTGSVGKTTTKEMCHAVLSARYDTLKTKGNLNSDTGLPLMLFEIMPEHEAAVLEMGMSAAGEIALMSGLAAPDAAIITNIGDSHIEALKSRENILSAKLEVQNGLSPKGALILNGDDPLLRSASADLRREALWYGLNPGCDFTASGIEQHDKSISFTVKCAAGDYPVELCVLGIHNVLNALAAIAGGFALGIPPERGAAALSGYKGISMRQNVYLFKGVRIIEDCYNASPDSMRAALSVLARHGGGRRIALLGDMLELGQFSEGLHREVGRAAAKSADAVVAYGGHSLALCDEAVKSGLSAANVFHEKKENAAARLLEIAKAGDTVLFKASRGMRAEDVLQEFCAALGE